MRVGEDAITLKVYFDSDIENTIKSKVALLIATHLATPVDLRPPVTFLRGQMSMACAFAIEYGVSWTVLLDEVKQDLGIDVLALLDSVGGEDDAIS